MEDIKPKEKVVQLTLPIPKNNEDIRRNKVLLRLKIKSINKGLVKI